MNRTLQMAVGICAGLASASVVAEECENGAGAKSAVGSYLSAMQEHRFKDAFEFVTETMTDGRVKDEWAGMQKLFYQGGEVNIFGIDIRVPQADENDPDCTIRAIVPNVLKSRDKFNNQGITEFEIYTVAKDGDTWKVDMQETLFDQPEVDKWFPGEKLEQFRDAY